MDLAQLLERKTEEAVFPVAPPQAEPSSEGVPMPSDGGAGYSVTETTPSGLEIYFQSEPRLYRLRQHDLTSGKDVWTEVPSVTTVLKVLDASGPLTWWGMGQGIQGVLELVRRGKLIIKVVDDE